jgi:two-component system catabolic regulation response regulator CreB/two-component system response regulator ChvI
MWVSAHKRIMIVDDERYVILPFKMGLEDNGFLVDTFDDPLEALSNFKAGVYDLLLIDIRMPKMSGFELYEKIKVIDSKVKACCITTHKVDYEKVRSLGINCIIRKPIAISDLIRAVTTELYSNNNGY